METNTLETEEGWTRIGAKSFPILESENKEANDYGIISLKKRYNCKNLPDDKIMLTVTNVADLVEFVLKNPKLGYAKELISEAFKKAGVEK